MEKQSDGKFIEAVSLLPAELKCPALFICNDEARTSEEIRLRAGRRATVLLPAGEKEFGPVVTSEMLAAVVENASFCSVHSAAESIKNAFITAVGGHRIGICGTAVIKEGKLSGFRNISSVCIRIAREYRGVGEALLHYVVGSDGLPLSTLLISRPGGGKTTLLRDFVRCISNSGVKVSVADERGEICSCKNGVPQFDVGRCTDVIELAPRSTTMTLLLRAMSPGLIAADELSSDEDVKAVEEAAGCGVSVMATAHGASYEDVLSRPSLRPIMQSGIFKRHIIISKIGGKRTYEIGEC